MKRVKRSNLNVDKLAERLAESGVGRADALKCFAAWMDDNCQTEKQAVAWLETLPVSFVEAMAKETLDPVRCMLQRMIRDSHQALKEKRVACVLSSAPEEKWRGAWMAEYKDRNLERFLKEAQNPQSGEYFLSAKSETAQFMLVCCNDRVRLLQEMTLAEIDHVAAAVQVQQRKGQDRRDFLDRLACVCTRAQTKTSRLTGTPLPTFAYLERVHANPKLLMSELDGTSMFFQAVAIARLYDWAVADEMDGSCSEEEARKVAEQRFAEAAGLGRSKLFRLRSLGHFLHSYPALCFQRLLTNVSGESGWENSGKWTVKQFQALIEKEKNFESQLNKLRFDFSSIIFPLGRDVPTLRGIPRKFRADRGFCVMPSAVRGANDGLFATEDMPVGMTWLMGGLVNDGGNEMDIVWNEMGVRVSRTKDGIAWKANEPPLGSQVNAVYLSSNEGVYLTICRELHASADAPVEIFVDYGAAFPRNYLHATYTKADEKVEAEAVFALKVVHGLRPRKNLLQ